MYRSNVTLYLEIVIASDRFLEGSNNVLLKNIHFKLCNEIHPKESNEIIFAPYKKLGIGAKSATFNDKEKILNRNLVFTAFFTLSVVPIVIRTLASRKIKNYFLL